MFLNSLLPWVNLPNANNDPDMPNIEDDDDWKNMFILTIHKSIKHFYHSKILPKQNISSFIKKFIFKLFHKIQEKD